MEGGKRKEEVKEKKKKKKGESLDWGRVSLHQHNSCPVVQPVQPVYPTSVHSEWRIDGVWYNPVKRFNQTFIVANGSSNSFQTLSIFVTIGGLNFEKWYDPVQFILVSDCMVHCSIFYIFAFIYH